VPWVAHDSEVLKSTQPWRADFGLFIMSSSAQYRNGQHRTGEENTEAREEHGYREMLSMGLQSVTQPSRPPLSDWLAGWA